MKGWHQAWTEHVFTDEYSDEQWLVIDPSWSDHEVRQS